MQKLLNLSIGYGELGGIGTVTKELTEALHAHGDHEVDVLTFWPWLAMDKQEPSFAFHKSDGSVDRYHTLDDFVADHPETDYDAVHMHSFIFHDYYLDFIPENTVCAEDFLDRYAAPKVLLAHSLVAREQNPHYVAIIAQEQMMSLADTIVHLAPDIRDLANETYPEFARKTVVIPNGTPVRKPMHPFVVSRCRETLQDYEGQKLGLFLGRLTEEKGIEDLIWALPEIRRAHPDFKLLIAGNKHDTREQEIRQMLAQSSMVEGRDYDLLGWVGDDDKQALLQAVDLTLMPSHWEHCPMVALESMMVGTPVAITNVIGPSSLFHLDDPKQRMAYPLSPGGEPDRLALEIGQVLSLERELDVIAKRAQHFVNNEHAWSDVAQKYVNLYASLADGSTVRTEQVKPSYKVGVVIPTHNRADYLQETVDSWLAQHTDHSYVLTIVDDGSIDNTIGMLLDTYGSEVAQYTDRVTGKKEVYNQSGKIHIIRQQNRGVSAARNTGLFHLWDMDVDYFCCHDDDDIAYPTKLQTLTDYLDTHQHVDLVHAKAVDIDADGNRMSKGTCANYFEALWQQALTGFDSEYLETVNYVHNQTTMFRREVVATLGLPNLYWEQLSYGEDWDFYKKVKNAGCTLGFCDEYVAGYRQHPGGVTWSDEADETLYAQQVVADVSLSEKVKFYTKAREREDFVENVVDDCVWGDYFQTVFSLQFERNFAMNVGDYGAAYLLAEAVAKLAPCEENDEFLASAKQMLS